MDPGFYTRKNLLLRHKLLVAYDGTNYVGWQTQPNGTAIQPLIQNALTTIIRSPVSLTASGRTDAGVHAKGQAAHFDLPEPVERQRLKVSLNALLPPDIRILTVDPVLPDFHARYSAKKKIYHYHLHLDPVMSPFTRRYATQIFGPCDLHRIREAIPFFLGTHDFLSFANEPTKGSAAKNAIRTLYRLSLLEQPSGVRFEFEGNGFLYKMVRNIVGVLLDVGAGKIAPQEIESIFQARDRKKASFTAPPQGLFLMEVVY